MVALILIKCIKTIMEESLMGNHFGKAKGFAIFKVKKKINEILVSDNCILVEFNSLFFIAVHSCGKVTMLDGEDHLPETL